MTSVSTAASTPKKFAFRTDIEGFRGLAMLLIVLWHADVPYLTGGYVALDIFFVMSGYLITTLLINEIERTGTVSLRAFWARRIRRLLPALSIMLAFVLVASNWIIAPTDRVRVAWDVLYANLYVVNWRFAAEGVDYLLAGAAASPVQHAWSLSVEEQFYIVWPIMLVAALVLMRWLKGRSVRWAIATPMFLIFAVSIIYSITQTEELGHAAYFSTFTRVWEFALGGLVALIPLSATPMRIRWLPTATMVVVLVAYGWTAVTFDAYTPYPGVAALIPGFASAAIMIAGMNRSDALSYRFFSFAPFRYAGKISYSWYLWHWPFVVFAVEIWGEMSYQRKLIVMAASLVPTLISYYLIENPLRRSPWLARAPRRSFEFAAAVTVALVLGAGILGYLTPTLQTASASEVTGARVLAPTAAIQESASKLLPVPRLAHRDTGQAKKDGCLVPIVKSQSPPCVFGDPDSSTTVVLYGASDAHQWFAAVEEIASRRGWRLVVLTKAGCPIVQVPIYNRHLGREYRECAAWRKRASDRIEREKPALVITTGPANVEIMRDGSRVTDEDENVDLLESYYVTAYRDLVDAGARVVVMGDTPRPSEDPLTCAAKHLDDLKQCAFPRDDAFRVRAIETSAANQVDGARAIQTRSWFCTKTRCPVVIGNALVYRNTAHITATYMLSLVPRLARELPRTL